MTDDGLRVFAAGSLRPAFDVMSGQSADRLRLTYANARDLAGRIMGGEAADVFASASPEHPRGLEEIGMAEELRAFASNRLVVAVPVASSAEDCEVLAAPGVRVVIEVAGIPLGDYTREALGHLDAMIGGGFAKAALVNVVAQEQTVDAVAALLLAGLGDAAVLYATDVAARPDQLRAIELPAAAAVAVTCVACVVAADPDRARALAWVDGLTDPAAQDILGRAGFGPPDRSSC